MPTLRQKRQSDLLARVFSVGDALIVQNRAAVRAAFKAAADKVRAEVDARDKLPASMIAGVADFKPPALDKGAVEAVVAVRMLAALDTRRTMGKRFPKREKVARFSASPEITALDGIDPLYAESARWMRRRSLATRAELAEIVEAVAVLTPNVPRDIIESEVRRQAAAFAGAPTAEMAKIFQNLISQSVGRGETVGEFLAAIDKAVAGGKLPPQADAYLHTVYRTETSLAYSEQRRKDWAHPDIQPFVWGRQLFNALLPTSRPTHVAINGLKLRKGSEADGRAGHPPFSYNCTCTEALIVVADPVASKEHVEPADAYARVSAIERF